MPLTPKPHEPAVPAPAPLRTLASLRSGDRAVIAGLRGNNPVAQQRLSELGFVAGEQVGVMATALWGRDPMAVRIGSSTFALRQHEAALVELQTDVTIA